MFILSGIDGICRNSGLHYQQALVTVVTVGADLFPPVRERPSEEKPPACPEVTLACITAFSLRERLRKSEGLFHT